MIKLIKYAIKDERLKIAKRLMKSWLFLVNDLNGEIHRYNYTGMHEIELIIKEIIGNDSTKWDKLKEEIEGGGQ